MATVCVDIPERTLERINNLIKRGSFENLNNFVFHAIELLLYAEENKSHFIKILEGGKHG